MQAPESINQSASEPSEKTVSFKLSLDDFNHLKAHCEQEGSTVSDFLRKRLPSAAPPLTELTAQHQLLRAQFELEKALDKLARSDDALAQAQQALVLEQDKRKKCKKRLIAAERSLQQTQSDAEGGLSGLVSSHPAVGEVLSNVLVRLAESPRIHQTIGSLMGTPPADSGLSEDDRALLAFARELLDRLSPAEFKGVVQICHLLVAQRTLISSVLTSLRTSQHTTVTPPSAAQPTPPAPNEAGSGLP